MSTEPNQELINHITKLLNSDTDCAHTRWAIALAHHNRLTVEDVTIEELDDLMSPDAETVGEWLEYLAEGEDTSVFTPCSVWKPRPSGRGRKTHPQPP